VQDQQKIDGETTAADDAFRDLVMLVAVVADRNVEAAAFAACVDN
jgi:hypothetical protein